MSQEILTITFTDTGVAYDPLAAKEPDLAAPLEERQLGGLGIFLVRKFMDSIEYRREDEKNILVLKKNLCSGEV